MENQINRTNINTVVQTGLKNRFQNLTPIEFEELVRVLFEKIYGYAELTSTTGDFGCDVLCKDKRNNKIVVQCKRFIESNTVGNKYVNDVYAAKTYYDAETAYIVTTSSFTNAAKEIAEKTDTKLVDWPELLSLLSANFNNGEPYLRSDFRDINHSGEILSVKVISITKGQTSEGRAGYFIEIEVKNTTKAIIETQFDMPILLTDSHQYQANHFWDEHFVGGKIYPKAKVHVGFIWLAENIQNFNPRRNKIYLSSISRGIDRFEVLEKKTHELRTTYIDIKDFYRYDNPEIKSKGCIGTIFGWIWTLFKSLFWLIIIIMALAMLA